MTDDNSALIKNFLNFSCLAVLGVVWVVLRFSESVKKAGIEKAYGKVVASDDDKLLADTFNRLR